MKKKKRKNNKFYHILGNCNVLAVKKEKEMMGVIENNQVER